MRLTAFTTALLLSGCAATNAPELLTQSKVITYYDYQLYSTSSEDASLNSFENIFVNYDVVLVGEWHSHPAVHLFQMQLLQKLHADKPGSVALSMEQFSRDKQDILDQYLAGEIGEQTLISEGKGWPNYESDYRPLVEFSKASHIPVIAANAPKPIIRCIGQEGVSYLDSLAADKRKTVAESINTSDTPYKEKFMASLHHGKPEDNVNNYAAQVTWDETMAESIVHYLESHPKHTVLHIAGKFHVEDGLGIASSIKRRAPGLKVAVITATDAISPESTDYQLLVLAPPVRYVKQENRMKAIHQIMDRKKSNICKP